MDFLNVLVASGLLLAGPSRSRMGRGRHGGPFFCNEVSSFFLVEESVETIG
jgi:hypothetical protein